MIEKWKNIDGYKGRYKISSFGRIKSFVKYSCGRILKTFKSCKYCRISLSKNSKSKQYLVHRLVGKYFVSNPENKPEINHLDNNPENNYYKNLKWVTGLENIQHCIKQGRANKQKGEDKPNSKLTEEMVLDIKRRIKEKLISQSDIAKELGVGRALINNIVKNRRWKHLK